MKSHATNRNRAYYRHHRERIINRKKSVFKSKHGYWQVPNQQYGRLAKGKIHCSCRYCSMKTSTDGFPKSQQARLDAQLEQLDSTSS